MKKIKFELTDETKVLPVGTKLHRIRALVDIKTKDVKVGDLGGWIEREENLSHSGNAWVAGNAKVFGHAKVSGNAEVFGVAEITGNAKVFGHAKVSGNLRITGNAKVFGYGRKK